MFLWWNTDTLGSYMESTRDLKLINQRGLEYPWEEVARFVREHSSPQDGLFVWGWYPGVYVQAQRFCPSRLASYSDMHSDAPHVVKRKIAELVKDLEANPPKFIVDSQKVEYPVGEHPVFDLWPQWKDRKRGILHFRYFSIEPLRHEGFLTARELEEAGDLIHQQVEAYSYALLTNEGRKGGPLESAKARELARLELARHESMAPLREFVVKNYRPVPVQMEMHVYEHRDTE